jgi:hypothetical protein
VLNEAKLKYRWQGASQLIVGVALIAALMKKARREDKIPRQAITI